MSDNTAEKQQEELDLEVEIIDDVPEEDKNKVRNEDAPKDNIPDDEEIKQYSKDVQKRLNKPLKEKKKKQLIIFKNY